MKRWLRPLKVKGGKMAAPFKGEKGERWLRPFKDEKGEKAKRWPTPVKGERGKDGCAL